MSVEYFVSYAATTLGGKPVTGRVAVITNRIISMDRIAELEKSISEQMGVMDVVIINWRRFEQAD